MHRACIEEQRSVIVAELPCAAMYCLVWSSYEVLAAVGSCDGSVSLNDASSKLKQAVLQCPEAAAVSGMTLSHDSRLLAAALNASV